MQRNAYRKPRLFPEDAKYSLPPSMDYACIDLPFLPKMSKTESSVECILLAIGLADRINELHRQTKNAQDQAFRLQQDLLEEREASEKVQRLEAGLRFKLASSIAHSGADGGATQLFKLEDFWLRTCSNLIAMWPAEARIRTQMTLSGAKDRDVFGNPYFLRSALDVLFSVSFERSVGRLNCSFQVNSPNDWILGLCGDFNWEKSISLALERCLNHILSNTGTSCTCTFKPDELRVSRS